MARKESKVCDNCLDVIDSISLELKSLELAEDSLSKLADEAIKSTNRLVTVDAHYLEVVSTALYNSLTHLKKMLD